MPGAISAGDKTKIRTHPHVVLSYLAIWDMTAVVKARVNAVPDATASSIVSIGIAAPTLGAYADVLSGMTVHVGSSDGAFDHGIFRAKSANSGLIHIGETSDFRLIANNDYVTVYQDWRPWAKHPYIDDDGVIYKDYNTAWSDANTAMPPKANGGPDWACAFIDTDDGYATVYFVDEDSFAVAPGASISNYAWATPSGDPASQSQAAASTSASPYEVHYDTAGQYIATLTVTDSNGKTGTVRIKVKIFDSNNMPYTDFEWKRTGSYERGGHQAEITARAADLSESVLPTGTAVAIFVDERHGTNEGSYGEYPHRTTIKFCGWVVRDDETRRPYLADKAGEVSFKAEGIEGMMRRLHTLGTFLEYTTSPASWIQCHTMTVTRAIMHLLQWHSTVCEVVHIESSNMSELVELQSFPEMALYGAVDALARQAFGRLGASKQNVMYLEKNVQLMLTATRAGVATVLDITEEDWAGELHIPKAQEPKVSRQEIGGIYYNGTEVTAVLALAPGPVPLHRGTERGPQTGFVFQGSSGVFQVGHLLKLYNNPYPNIPVRMNGAYDFADIFPREYFTLASGTLKRGPELDSSDNFFINNISVQSDNRLPCLQCTWTLEAEAIGAAGMSIDIPESPDPPEPTPPDEPPEPPLPPEPPPEAGEGTLYLSTDGEGPFMTDDGGATWTDIGD